MALGANNWADATPIALGEDSDPTPNSAFTWETGEPHIGNSRSAWWRFDATADGLVGFSSSTSSGFFDNTLVCVYTGSAVNALTAVTNSDDSRAHFTAVSGTTYWVQVATRESDPQDYVLRARALVTGDFLPGLQHVVKADGFNPPVFLVNESELGFVPVSTSHNLFVRTSTPHFLSDADAFAQARGEADTGTLTTFGVSGTTTLGANRLTDETGIDWRSDTYSIRVQMPTLNAFAYLPKSHWPADAFDIEFDGPPVTIFTESTATLTGDPVLDTADQDIETSFGLYHYDTSSTTDYPGTLQGQTFRLKDDPLPLASAELAATSAHWLHAAAAFIVDDALPSATGHVNDVWHLRNFAVTVLVGFRSPNYRFLFAETPVPPAAPPVATRVTPSLRMLQRGGQGGMSGIPRMIGNPVRGLRQGPGSVY